MEMMGVKDYAKKMASSESQIRQMCADGILPSIKIGKAYKIDVARADEYFTRCIDERMAEGARKQKMRSFSKSHKMKNKKDFDFQAELGKLRERMAQGTKEVAV